MIHFFLLAGVCLSISVGENLRAWNEVSFGSDQVLVRLVPGSLPEQLSIRNNPSFGETRLIVPSLDLYVMKLRDRTTVAGALRVLNATNGVLYAQPDHKIARRSRIPNDTSFDKQWNIKNSSSLADISATKAWDLGVGGKDRDGNDIVVAVVDGGMDLKHPDLVENLWIHAKELPGNGIDDDGNGYVDDVNGWSAYSHSGNIGMDEHGTHVAGIVGASGNNNLHVAGVNWRVKLMPVAAASYYTSVVAEGYGYVIAQKKLWLESSGSKGANVVATNSSFGVNGGDCKAAAYRVWNELYEEMGKYGILSAAATANENVDVDKYGDIPTGCPSSYLISVTNTDRNDQKVPYAGFGLTTIALGAPGMQIFSTVPGGADYMTGTSMATPHVAGAVALLHSVASASFQKLNQEDPAKAALTMKKIILEGVDKIESLKGITITGGRLNLATAAEAITRY